MSYRAPADPAVERGGDAAVAEVESRRCGPRPRPGPRWPWRSACWSRSRPRPARGWPGRPRPGPRPSSVGLGLVEVVLRRGVPPQQARWRFSSTRASRKTASSRSSWALATSLAFDSSAFLTPPRRRPASPWPGRAGAERDLVDHEEELALLDVRALPEQPLLEETLDPGTQVDRLDRLGRPRVLDVGHHWPADGQADRHLGRRRRDIGVAGLAADDEEGGRQQPREEDASQL